MECCYCKSTWASSQTYICSLNLLSCFHWWKHLVHCWNLFKDGMFLSMTSLQLWRSTKANFIGYNFNNNIAFISDYFVHQMVWWYATINRSTWSGSQITIVILLNTFLLCWMVRKYGLIWVSSIHNKEWCFQWHKQHLLMYYNL